MADCPLLPIIQILDLKISEISKSDHVCQILLLVTKFSAAVVEEIVSITLIKYS